MLRITTTDTVLHALLLPVMRGFGEKYSQIQLELVATNTVANLSQRDADIAIRATRRPPDHLVGTRLVTLRAAVFASRDYLAKAQGEIDLATTDWITLDESLSDHPSVRWGGELRARGRTVVYAAEPSQRGRSERAATEA